MIEKIQQSIDEVARNDFQIEITSRGKCWVVKCVGAKEEGREE